MECRKRFKTEWGRYRNHRRYFRSYKRAMGATKNRGRGKSSDRASVPIVKRKLIQALRQVLRYYCPERKAAIEKYKVKVPLTKKDGTPSKRYTNAWPCSACGELFSKVEWDHIEEVGKEPSWPPIASEWGIYIERMFCSQDNYQPLCKICHNKKTKESR